ncbi:TRM11 family SAM-dependent methyltransferase [Micromonospora thermarum]|uniref:Methyltransferase n=1 Tax=Micromonospora thermarum TaxID=2720024 RepID=A0ABX0YZ32_9ACTN|nr:DNA methyltransferase [Micromonospora thermarum]NJP30752.1 DNA methylase [Micromonospora thermarum]
MVETLPISEVWLTCQIPARDQRRGRYVPGTSSHPAKMLPHLAARAISSYSDPGELVFDPMCGAGTTLVEAMHLGRYGIGVDIEPRFSALAQANIELASSQKAAGAATVHTGDARYLLDLVPASAIGRVGLVLTSPPYGRGTHGLVRTTSAGVRKRDHHYGDRERGNLAYAGWSRLFDGFAAILAASYHLLRPGGTVVITCRPVRRQRDDLIDLPGELLTVARSVGLEPMERTAAMLAAVRDDGQIVHRASMFNLMAVRRARDDGIPVHLTVHEDVLILRRF